MTAFRPERILCKNGRYCQNVLAAAFRNGKTDSYSPGLSGRNVDAVFLHVQNLALFFKHHLE